MKKHFLLCTLLFFSFHFYGQISFEKGYYIANDGQKIECLIKNVDWRSNPDQFKFKLSELDEIKTATILTVKEFGITNNSKYIRANVKIDRSRQEVSRLSSDRSPNFKEEILFLKVLVEGNASLYRYSDKNIDKFFFKNNSNQITQLVFKNYKKSDDKIGVNNLYKQQLYNNLTCVNFKQKRVNNLNYTEKSLVKYFKDYSKCQETPLTFIQPKNEYDFFRIHLRPRINNSDLSVSHQLIFPNHIMEFKNKLAFGIGVETEFVLPFNKNKWSIIFEPSYQSYKSEGLVENVSTIFGGSINSKIEYSSIEIPFGFRHYFYLQNESNIFINASLVFDILLNSTFSGTHFNGSSAFDSVLESESIGNFAFGLGYKLDKKFSLEMRYQTNRQIIDTNRISVWGSRYRTLSLIFGYRIF